MFYGLNNFIKKIFPKRLFYRALIIVAAPVIILQIIISIVFFDSIWIKANKGMTRSLVSEIETLFDVYKSNQTKENIKQITDLYKKNFDFVINIKSNEFIKSRDRALQLINEVNWENGFFRKDIGYKVIE